MPVNSKVATNLPHRQVVICVVTQSVRTAIPVGVRILDRDGVVLAG